MEKGEEDFVNQVVNLLSLRTGRAVMVIVHSEKGLEILDNTSDIVHKRGMLETAIDVLRDVRAATEEAIRETRREAEETVELIMKNGGKAN